MTPQHKHCTKCKELKPIDEFGRNKKARDGRSSWCRACTNTNKMNSRAKNVKIIEAHKDKSCMDCGIQYDSCAMTYDHRDPETKNFGVSEAWSRPIPDILEEISKCDVVCLICHSYRTRDRLLNNPEWKKSWHAKVLASANRRRKT